MVEVVVVATEKHRSRGGDFKIRVAKFGREKESNVQ